LSERVTGYQLTAIYDAAFAKDRWNQALDAFYESSSAAGLLLYDVGDQRAINYSAQAVNSAYAWIAEILPEYNRMMEDGRDSGLDREGSTIMHGKPAFTAVRDSDIWTIDRSFVARPEIQFTINQLGTFRRFFLNLSEDPLSYSALIVHYPTSHDGAPPVEDMRRMEPLSAHLGKVLEIHRTMSVLRRKYDAVLSVLDKIDVAICILDARAYPFVRNRRAEETLDAKDSLWMDGRGRIVCQSPDTTARLQAAIKSVCGTAAGENDDRSQEIEIERKSVSDPLYAIVSPLRDADMELERGLTGAMLTVVDGARTIEPSIRLVLKAYGLTSAEGRVAVLLAKGMSNAEISARLGVGTETIKSHVSSILAKTRSRNRLSFVWKVFQFLPPVL